MCLERFYKARFVFTTVKEGFAPMDSGALVVFEDRKIRRIWFNKEWYYSVVDIAGILSDSEDPRKYWNKLSQRLRDEGSKVVTFCHQLKLPAADGKLYATDCMSIKPLFRLVQSIPSPKAEPFKLWLAQVGYERVQEIENPELAQKRMKELFKQKGYSDDWVEKRVRGITIRDELTDEWSKRGVKNEKEYAILTAEISKATFGMTPSEYKNLKGLKRENLRDHMNDLELIFTMLSEAATTNIARVKNAQGFIENETVAKEGGEVAGVARKRLESKTGEKVVSSSNYLNQKEKQKQLK